MVLDLHQFNRREKILRQKIGISKEDRFLKDSEVYTIYFNPATGIYTGIKDNERNVFYEFKNQLDIQKFINSVNIKEKKNSIFLYGIKKTLKEFEDREIEFFEKIQDLDEKCVFYSRIIDYFVSLLNYSSREVFIEEMEKTLDKWEELR